MLVIDEDYRFVLVAGSFRVFLWFLACVLLFVRATLDTLVVRAKGWGFASDELINVDQPPRVQRYRRYGHRQIY